MTWYRSARELPDLLDYDIIRNHVTYQYYDGEALYPFGHGLSYASFAYSDFTVNAGKEGSLIANVTVTNTSEVAGDEVVQLYYHPESTRIPRPIKKLCGFRRIFLNAGERRTISMEIERDELAFWDVSRERFAVEDGAYTFMVGASSSDIRISVSIHVAGEVIPPRDLTAGTKAFNYDGKHQAQMLWSKKLETHYMTPSGFAGALIFKNCCLEGGEVLELTASSWERAQNLTVLAECDGKTQKLGELIVPPTDGRDDFRKLLLPIAPEFARADLRIVMQGSVALLSIRMGKETSLNSKESNSVSSMQNKLNTAYYRLEMKQAEIVRALLHRMFELESGWYNGHYHKGDNGNWSRESYPIPVIGVKGFCDVEIHFDKISVSAKLKRDAALSYSFEKFAGYEFEAYGAEDYLADLYHAGQTVQAMKDNIRACDEKEIGFSFVFPFDVEGRQIFEFVKLLRREGFYY